MFVAGIHLAGEGSGWVGCFLEVNCLKPTPNNPQNNPKQPPSGGRVGRGSKGVPKARSLNTLLPAIRLRVRGLCLEALGLDDPTDASKPAALCTALL